MLLLLAVFVFIPALMTSIAALVTSLRNHKTLKDISVKVDGNITTLTNRITQLTKTIESSNKSVPPSPQVEPPGAPSHGHHVNTP